MSNKELINLLLNLPMDMEVAIALPHDDAEAMDVWNINTADIIEIEEKPVIALFWEYVVDPSLN